MIGAYPTNEDGTANPCYDPNRPGILPYFIDTFTEEACRHAGGDWFGVQTPFGGSGARIDGGDIVVEGAPSKLDNTLQSILTVGLVLGVGYMFMGLYLRKGR